MRITLSKSFKFKLADYEQMDVMSSVTVDSADLGVSDEERVGYTDGQAETHWDELIATAKSLLQEQIVPLVDEATVLAERKSSAHDVMNYYKGQGA